MYNKGIMIGYVISIYIFCPFYVTYVTFNTTWTVLSIQKENLSDTILFNHWWLIIWHKSFEKYEYLFFNFMDEYMQLT